MVASMTVSLFIPDSVFNQLLKESLVLGYYHISKNNILVNCTTIIRRQKQDFDSIFNKLSNYNSTAQETIQFLGLLYSSEKKKHIEIDYLKQYSNDIAFILRINETSRSFHIEHLVVSCSYNFKVQVIIYDGYSISNSQLLPLHKNVCFSETSEKTFVSFLVGTCHDFLNNFASICVEEVLNFIHVNTDKVLQFNTKFLFTAMWIASIFYKITSYMFKWWPEFIMRLTLLTALGQQFHQRYFHCAVLCSNFKEVPQLSLKCKNLICAILFDLLCGCIVTYALLNTDISDVMLKTAILKTNDIVGGLQNLIYWLMGVPAGLKLNIPLNSALGKFFLYHIYLWESYMMVVQPLFSFIFKMSTIIGIFGLTFVLSLLNDLISLATVHIYCFYGYAARLYGYQVMSLAALWRLFRGKKWNPLRQRIDSYTYSVHQLYLGTLIFTVLLFLLPTVMVYYFVFTCLRILVLIIQGVMSRVINVLTVCPLYCVVSRILNSSETTGDIYFTVLNAEDVLTLSMQASQIPLMTVINLTLPEIKKFYEVLTWKEFSSCIIWGKIVYPL